MGVCYRALNQVKEVDEVLYRCLEKVSESLVLDLGGRGLPFVRYVNGNTTQQTGNSPRVHGR